MTKVFDSWVHVPLFSRYENDRLTDVTIQLGKCTFSAHQVVLACHSPSLAAQISKPQNNGVKVEIQVSDNITPTAFQIVLDYMYKGGGCFQMKSYFP